jgi:hypothetical protein
MSAPGATGALIAKVHAGYAHAFHLSASIRRSPVERARHSPLCGYLPGGLSREQAQPDIAEFRGNILQICHGELL